ncbi:MICOS complex subunit MIC12 [Madurella fahalii]|uniref:MICOS complex subunit MIC12 n=1 Tax=Madurella fahalii TaxID=1157608 RepID=A0ABQ0G883_9PEZI
MGFVAGLTGGVTLTLSLTYLALLTHKRNRQSQSSTLRSQTFVIDSIIPLDPSIPPSQRRRNASTVSPDGTYRPRPSLEQYSGRRQGDASFLETAKSRWNAEISSAVHWAQTKDWAAVREDAEDSIAGLLGIKLSREPVRVETVVVEADSVPTSAPASAPSLAERAPPVHAPPPASVPAPAPSRRAADALHNVQTRAVEAAHTVRDEAKEVVSRGVEKAHDLVSRAKAAVYLAEEKAETKMDAKLLHVSEIEQALQERYDGARREERMKKSVQEVLAERYAPSRRGITQS